MQHNPRGLLPAARRRLVGIRLAALGTAGVVIGHTLTYLLVMPDGHRRTSLLKDTGHAYWRAAVVASVLAAVPSIVSHIVGQFRAARSADLTTESIRRTGVRLALFQVSVYALMEIVERIAAHQPLASMFENHLLLVGALLQVTVAGVLVQFLRLVGRAVVAVARRLTRPASHRRPVTGCPRFVEVVARSQATWNRPGPSRAPPVAA